MEKQKDIHIAEVFFPFLPAGKGDIYEGFKIIKLFYSIHGTRLENASAAPALCQVGGLAVSGRVHAGFPSPAEEELRDVISFDDYLAPHPETSFLLSVTGDSMIGAGILEGDVVILKRTESADSGDIVLALLDSEEATLKRLRKRGNSIALEAANPAYETRIFGPDRVAIQGKLVAMIRRYS